MHHGQGVRTPNQKRGIVNQERGIKATWLTVVSLLIATAALSTVGAIQAPPLPNVLTRLTEKFNGRVGVCVRDSTHESCVNGGQRFPLQSVMKLLVGIAVMDAVEHRGWSLNDGVVVRKEDLSLAVQPLARLVTADGFHTTVDDLVRRAIVDSDSAATDVLVARLGGPGAVQRVLDRRHVTGVRFDRDERHLQTEIAGLEWRSEFVDSTRLDRAYAAVPEARRDAAYRAYQKDPRDTATPAGMAALLWSLANGQLLSPASTTRLLDIMAQTVTFPDRLKAGVSGGWTLAHKTGTSGTWRGVTAATNDVGILTAPDGTLVSIAVFIADSSAASTDRADLIARIARSTIASY
jgi:beta-lactamase class A